MINIYYTNKHYYKKLFFTLCTLFLLIAPNKSSTSWVEKINEHHILDDNYWNDRTNENVLFSFITSSISITAAIKAFCIVYNCIKKNEPLPWKYAVFSSCSFACLLGTAFFTFKDIRDKTPRKVDPCNSGYIKPTPRYSLATAILIHNKDRNVPKKNSWQKICLLDLIRLESIASQCYEMRLMRDQKENPSWLLPPQKFETKASITINKNSYPFRKPCKENWLQAQFRAFLAPYPKRPLTLQKKIVQILRPHIKIKRLLQKKLPPEIVEHIFSYEPINNSELLLSKIDISNEEFFVNILPYIKDILPYITNISPYKNFVTTDSDPKNKVQILSETWNIIYDFYNINDLFKGGIYNTKTRTLILQKIQLVELAIKLRKSKKYKKYLKKKLAQTLNLPQENITYENDHVRNDHQFYVIE